MQDELRRVPAFFMNPDTTTAAEVAPVPDRSLPNAEIPDTMPGRRNILVIYNPIAGRRHKGFFADVLDALVTHGCSLTIRETGWAGHAVDLAGTASGEDHDAIVVAGGDGTINEVINGLGPTAPPVGIIPLGTANVLAREIGLRHRAADVAATIRDGHVLWAHLGEAASDDGRRVFVLMLGAGFDARVVAGVGKRLKRALGKFAYVWRSVVEIVRYRDARYRVIVDGSAWQGSSVVVANGRFYGGPYIVCPAASLAAPRLDICVFRRAGRWAAISYATSLVLGRMGRRRDVTHLQGTDVRIEGPAHEPVQADGDIVAHLPVTVTLSERRLPLIVPG